MAKRRKPHKTARAEPQHEERKPTGTNDKRGRTMATVLVYVLPVAAAIALAVAGMIYSTQKILSIWMVFGAVVISALAGCLYWQQLEIAEANNPPFAVAIETSLVGRQRDCTQVFCEYNQKFLSPIPISLFMRLVNLQDVPSDISQLKIEVELKKRHWIFPSAWLRTRKVPEYMPLVWVNSPPTPSMSLSLVGGYLEPILESGPLQPHRTLRGWVLLDVSEKFDSAAFPPTFRISVKDTAGHKLTVLDSGPTGEENVFPERGFQTKSPIDIRGFQIRHLADGSN
jgi:hypothetical protein